MVLEEVFRRPSIPIRLRTPPLGAQLDGFCQWLRTQRYSGTALHRRLWQVSHFNRYLQQAGIKDCREIERNLAERFLSSHMPRCRCEDQPWRRRLGTPRAVRSILDYLETQGLLPSPSGNPPMEQGLHEEFLGHLKSERNLAERTIKRNRQYLVPFLEGLGPGVARERLQRLSPGEVHRFFVKYSEKARPQTRRGVQAFLRTFLRFCLKQGYVERDLSQAVPKIRKYRLSHVPRGPSEEEIRKILGGIDRTTPVGRRDFAILQLLSSYGVRGGQVRALKLVDIRWRGERIRFPAMKGGKEVVEPLTDEVGESLLDYLRHGRPEVACPEVFLTSRAPFKPLTDSGAVTMLVRARMRRAGVTGYTLGSHTFRHAFATRMLAKGQPLKTIADMLGHRNINTTFIYTKVDLVALRQLPLHWPEV